jgi:hypothetical protein
LKKKWKEEGLIPIIYKLAKEKSFFVDSAATKANAQSHSLYSISI